MLVSLGLSWVIIGIKTNGTERLASSVVRQVTFQLRNSADLSEALGEHVKLETNWWSESTNNKVDGS
jgi:cytochrome c oxidase assembly factor 1